MEALYDATRLQSLEDARKILSRAQSSCVYVFPAWQKLNHADNYLTALITEETKAVFSVEVAS